MAYIGREPAYGSFEKQALTADSSTTTFNLNYTVGSSSSILVSVAGVHQEPEVAYNLASGGTQIVFTAAPTTGDTVFVIFLGIAYDAGELLSSGTITNKTALTTGVQGADTFLVYDDSAASLKKLTLANLVTGLTELSAQAATNDVLLIYDTDAGEIKKIQQSNISPTLSYTTRNATGDGVTTDFTVTSGVTVDDVLVFENGICQKPTTDYTISGTTLTFSTAPANGVAIQIRELP
jgi:hypothetical protein